MSLRMTDFRRRCMPGVWLLLAFVLSGCATQTQLLRDSPSAQLSRSAELSSTPFFAQERYQCGPAALAMALNTAGVSIHPDALVSQVYVPQREGSLQTEMLAAARRNGAVSMTIPPRMDALLTEVASGTPVVVLQNLSLPWYPMWHYAVMIGYDLDRNEAILRSGTTERLTMPLSTFERTWARSGYWGMVALPAGRLPATVEESAAVSALVAFEKNGDAVRSRQAYQAALQRWPDNLTLQLGYGNSAYSAGDRAAAAAAYMRATQAHPDSAPAFNNLATVLAELGDFELAREAAERALALGGPWRDAALATLKAINAEKRPAGR